jgi:sugar lactone lactonase YvrE
MRYLAATLTAVLLTLGAWAASSPLPCSRDLAAEDRGLDRPTPTDVALDPQGRIYVLYGREGFLDVLAPDGTRLQRRGGGHETEGPPQRMTPLSLWVGPDSPPLTLASAEGGSDTLWLLALRQGKLLARPLKGAPAALSGRVVVAPGYDRRDYVLDSSGTVYAFAASGGFQYRLSLPGIRDPQQMELDRQRNFFVLDRAGLKVFSARGVARWEIPGARAFHLAGDNRLVAAGDDWVRKYSADGNLLAEALRLEVARGRTPVAVSLTGDGSAFVYYRDPGSGGGLIVKFDARLTPGPEFFQPVRFPPQPDPGFRLDSAGHLHFWDRQTRLLVKMHPGGKVYQKVAYVAPSDQAGRLKEATDLALDRQGVVWIADSGNYRLQRFDPEQGWLEPVGVGIRGVSSRGIPRQVAVDTQGRVLCVVYPATGAGQVVLQRRDGRGALVAQSDLGDAAGDPVIKVAAAPDGGLFLYRSGGRPGSADYYPNPVLVRLSAAGARLARVGGEDLNFHLPGNPRSRIELKPEEQLIAWGGGLVIPWTDKILILDGQLNVLEARSLRHARGMPGGSVSPDFAGGAIRKEVLYVADMANQCLHRVPLR